MFYFKAQAREIITRSLKDKIVLPLPNNKIIYRNHSDQLNDSFHIKNYLLDDKYQNIYLTNQEMKIMQLCSFGNSAKEIAICLSISHRTIEHHIDNVKKKLSCSKLPKLLYLLREAGVIK